MQLGEDHSHCTGHGTVCFSLALCVSSFHVPYMFPTCSLHVAGVDGRICCSLNLSLRDFRLVNSPRLSSQEFSHLFRPQLFPRSHQIHYQELSQPGRVPGEKDGASLLFTRRDLLIHAIMKLKHKSKQRLQELSKYRNTDIPQHKVATKGTNVPVKI